MKPDGLLFNCEFGSSTGWGHITRCSALASTAKSRGIKTALLTDGDITTLPSEIQESYDFIWGNTPIFPKEKLWQEIAKSHNWKTLVLDNYAYNITDLVRLRGILQSFNIQLTIIDDFNSQRTQEADWTIIPGLAGENLGINNPAYMCGLNYCLLRPGFTQSFHQPKATPSTPLKVAIMLGGTDPFKLTPKAIKYLANNNADCYEPILFFSKKPKNEELIQELLQNFPKHQWLERQSSSQLATWFNECDFGITACGGTVYEMATFNLPFMGIVSASNQEFTGNQIKNTWKLPVIETTHFTQENFNSEWNRLIQQFKDSKKPYTKIDGNGCQKIIDKILELEPVIA